MSFTAKLLLWSLMTIFVVSGAKAQLAIPPRHQNLPACIEKGDAYQLAFADTQNRLAAQWSHFVEAGHCRYMMAMYLFTVETYIDHEKKESRIVEMLAYGERVWGIRAGLPGNVWMVQHNEHPQDRALHDRFYEKWNMPNNGLERRTSCCNKNDCYPTSIKLEDGKYYARRREDGAWIHVPNYKLEQLQTDPVFSPDHQSHACMQPPGMSDQLYCATLGAAI